MKKLVLTFGSVACLVLSGQSLRAATGFSGVHVGGSSGGYSVGHSGGFSGGHSGGVSGGRSGGGSPRHRGGRSRARHGGGSSPRLYAPSYYSLYTYTYRPYLIPDWEVSADPRARGGPADRAAASEREFARCSGYELGRPGYAITYSAAVGRDGSVAVSGLEWRSKAGAIAKSKWEQ